jgi:hypothetical protein
MIRRSSRLIRTPAGNSQVLVTSALALTLTAMPIGIDASDPGLQWQTAIARNGDGGGGNGQGGGHGNGGGNAGNGHGNAGERGGPGRDHAHGHDNDHGGPQGRAQGYHDVDELVDSVRSGKALGLERRDERIDRARERYAAARGKTEPARHGLQGTDEAGPAAHRLSPEETKALMERGWKGPATRDAGFRNHGERVRTMVELSKRLGYGARVGALQANFGTPQENRITALQAELAQARAAGDQAAVARLESALAEAIAKAKPGNGPDDSWATADLDVNEDGVVDRRDLEALEQDEAAGAPAAS